MTIELIQFNENGQGYIDFDALEMVTSKDLVEDVRFYVDELGYSYETIRSFGKYVSVYLVHKSTGTYRIFCYNKVENSFDVNTIHSFDIEFLGFVKKGDLHG